MGVTVLPISADVQFPSAASGKLYLDSLTDPSGAPLDVLDNNLGVIFDGHVDLPAWLVGKGVVTVYADEIGGAFDSPIGTPDTFAVTGAASPGVKTYNWSVTVPAGALPDVDMMYQIGIVFMLQTSAGAHTDIAAFFDLGAYLAV